MEYRLKAFLITIAIAGTFVLTLAATATCDWAVRPGTIEQAITQPDGTMVYLDAVITDKIKGRQNPGYFVIHEAWRWGSRIIVDIAPPAVLRKGQTIDVEGVIGTLENGERAILNPRVIGYFDEDGNLLRHGPFTKGLLEPMSWQWKADLIPAVNTNPSEPASISVDPEPSPALPGSIAGLFSENPLGSGAGKGVKLQRKKIVAKGIDPTYGKYFVIGEDSSTDTLKVYSSTDVDATDRVNEVVGQVRTDGEAVVLAVDSGPGYDPQGYSGVVQATEAGTIGYARTLSDDTLVTISGKIVTADGSDFIGRFYIQEPDCSAGILVSCADASSGLRGAVVNVTGTLDTAPNGERQIVADIQNVIVTSTSSTTAQPMFISNRDLGGSSFNDLTPGITFPIPGAGLYNKSMLVKICGRVTASDQSIQTYYIDDGSHVENGPGEPVGVKVIWNAEGGATSVPAVGDFLADAIGISSSEARGGGQYSRVLLVRGIAIPVVNGTALSRIVDLAWNPQDHTGYRVYRGLSEDGPFDLLATIYEPSFRDTSVTNGTTYYYKVSGIAAGVEGTPSAVVTLTPTGGVPTVTLSSFDSATGTYVYTVSCPPNNEYPFGYFQIDTMVTNAAPTGPWSMQGPFVDGINNSWPVASVLWDPLNIRDSAIWGPVAGVQLIPENTAWQADFIITAPESEPVVGTVITSIGNGGAYQLHTLLVPGQKTIAPSNPPTTHISLEGTLGANDWYTSVVKVTLEATDPENDVESTEYKYKIDDQDWITYAEPFDVTEEGEHLIVARSADSEGNVEDPPIEQSFKIDAIAPTVTGTPITQPNANGWYNSDVQVNFAAVDGTSGLDSPTAADPGVSIQFTKTVSTEGNDLSCTATATDKAGNQGSGTVSGVKLDKSAPVLTVVSVPTGDCHVINYEQAVIQFTATDNLSEIQGLPWGVVNITPTDGWAEAMSQTLNATLVGPNLYEVSFPLQVPGVYVVTLFAKDKADNVGELSAPLTFGAGGFTVEWLPPISTMDTYIMADGSTVPVKFRLVDPCNNNAFVNKYQYTMKVVFNSPTGEKIIKAIYTPEYDPGIGGYHVNVQTKDGNNVDWELGDYTVIIEGPGIWDVISGPYKSQYGLQLVERAVAKGVGRR